MSPIRLFALVFGVVFLLVGICGFVPGFLTSPMPNHPGMRVTAFDGYLFGLFHVNAVHSAAHLLFGILGLLMAGRASSARAYGLLVAVAYGGLVVLGLIPATNNLFGLCPLAGNDVWLHVVLAAAGGAAALLLPPRGTGPTDGFPAATA